MKNGKLEDFIKENRMTFDQYMPDRQIWYRIENQMDKNDLRKLIIAWSTRIAAAFLVVLFCGIILGISIGNARQSQFDYASSPELKRYQETESYYQKEIGIKLNEVTDPQIKSNVEIDLNQLDEIYKQLKQEMISSDYSNRDLIINAMIKNYKTKVEILEYILQNQNKIKNESEKISI